MSSVKSNFLNDGETIPVVTTVINVIVPPKTTAETAPINFAVKPLSKLQAHWMSQRTWNLLKQRAPSYRQGFLIVKLFV